MSNPDQLSPELASKPPDRVQDTAGMMLRKARESANLTHAAVSEALHLTVHYIKALENDDYSKLPGATFVKGYLRAYARYLKLDVNAVLASYEKNNVSAAELNNRTEMLSRNQKRHDQTFRWAVVTAVIIVLGVAAGWWFAGKDQVVSSAVTVIPQAPLQQQATPSAATAGTIDRTTVSRSFDTPAAIDDPAAQDPPAETALAAVPEQENVALTVAPTADGARQVTLISAGADMIELHFKGTSRVEIDDDAKGRLYNETLNSGDAVTLQGTAPFQVLLGDAAQVELSFNSVPVNLGSQIRTDKSARFLLGAAAAPTENAATVTGTNP